MSRVVSVREVEAVRAAVRAVAASLDASWLAPQECERALAAAAAIESMAATMTALLAARLAELRRHESTSAVSAEALVAQLTGATPARARERIATGARLGGLAATAARARAGELSPGQAQAIAAAAEANPAAERALLAAAPSATLGQLRDQCARATAAAERDPAATHERLRRGRSGRRYGTAEGFAHLHLQSTAQDMAEIDVTLTPIVDELFHAARREGRRERREAYVVDAVVEMARRARGVGGPPRQRPPTYTAVLRADLAALARGSVAEGEVCEIAGLGPVPAGAARGILGDALLRLVLTRGVEVRNVTTIGRGARAAAKVAMLWEQPECQCLGCGRRARLERDHRFGREFSKTGVTRLADLDNLCEQHHDKKTYEGWALVEGAGVRPMVPPQDHRHPANAARRRRPP